MKIRSLQMRLWHFSIITAILAVLLALGGLDLAETVALLILALIVFVPVVIASPEHRLGVAAWVVSLHPVMVPVYLYAAWAIAWCVLGHRPRSSLDDPKFIS